MAVNAQEILQVLEAGGVEVRLEEDRLIGRMVAGGPLPTGARRFIQRFREAIVAELGQTAEPTREAAYP
jgi:hypothetical protein